MPGITGMLGRGTSARNNIVLGQMVEAMTREPFYTSGMYANDQLGCWFGWTSLKGSFSDGMPIWNEKRDRCIVFSGEDGASREDMGALRRKGHDFEAAGAGYLIHLYEENGPGFLEKLNGRFSGVLVDLPAKQVFLFNDRYGLGRIYYHESGDGLYFSSEAKTLLKVLPEIRRLNDAGLAESFSFGCVFQNKTLFSGISLLPGGSLWTFAPGRGIRKDVYFRRRDWESQEPLGEAEYYARLRETWARILPGYARGGEPVGMSLTGGKDTRMILAWLKPPPGTLPCYTFGGMYRECADVRLARRIAKACRQPHQVLRVGKAFLKEFPALAERVVHVSDGAMDVSASPDLYVNRMARQIAPIRLTGNYGQEILHASIALKPGPWDGRHLDPEFHRLTEAAAETYREELAGDRLSFVAFKQVPWHHFCRLSVELSQLTLRSPYLDTELVALAYRGPREPAKCVALQLRLIAEGDPALARIATDLGVLYRPVPVVTQGIKRFKELTFKAEYAYDHGMPQTLARIDHVLEPLRLEEFFLGRHKFYHFRIWYRTELAGYIQEVLLDPRSFTRSYISRRQLENVVHAHVKGRRNYTSEIHRLLTAELIQRQFID